MVAPDPSSPRTPLEPEWPRRGDGPVLFLLDASSRLERRLMEDWIRRAAPPDHAGIQVVHIPASRRRRRNRSLDPALEERLRADGDVLLVPLRVIWLAPERDGGRVVGWRDLLSFGDPRDPDPVRQHIILRTRPDRCRIIMGTPAGADELRARWAHPEARSDGTSLGDYVALQAWLALERAERAERGNRYKVPKFLREDLYESRAFAQGVARLARETGSSFDAVARRSLRYLKEIAANHSPYVIDLVNGGIRWLIDKAYQGLHYDEDRLHEIYRASHRHPLVFLPSHKSNFDHLVLSFVLYQAGLPQNHTAGGINMNFFPVGPLIRRAGVFFIRRSFKDNEPYKFVLRQYIDYLLRKRFPLEWYLEGGRSRSGKLRPPRFGMLSYVAGSLERGSSDDVVLIPISIAYDQIFDVGSYAEEVTGGAKERESFGWFYKAVRSLRRRYGAIHMRFGTPVSLREMLDGYVSGAGDDQEAHHLAVQKTAFEVLARINDATPITPISLVALALLSQGDRALTITETMAVLEPYLEYVKRRDLPTTEVLALDTPERVRAALDALTEHNVVTRFTGATETVYTIAPDQHHAAAYYRNTIIHFFLVGAIAELALLAAAADGVEDPAAEFWAETLRLRDLLKFEFYFAPKDDYRAQIVDELAGFHPEWEELLAAGRARDILRSIRQPRAQTVLRPFLNAYSVVADVLDHADGEVTADDAGRDAIALGKQYVLQNRIRTHDAVSTALFETAIRLAEHRGLLEAGTAEARAGFAAGLHTLANRLDALDALVAGRRTGVLR